MTHKNSAIYNETNSYLLGQYESVSLHVCHIPLPIMVFNCEGLMGSENEWWENGAVLMTSSVQHYVAYRRWAINVFIIISDRKNYFWHARRNFNALPDILSPCQTFFPVDDWQISMVILVFLAGHFMWVEPCWTKYPERIELSAGHQQKSAGHVRHVQHISRPLL